MTLSQPSRRDATKFWVHLNERFRPRPLGIYSALAAIGAEWPHDTSSALAKFRSACGNTFNTGHQP